MTRVVSLALIAVAAVQPVFAQELEEVIVTAKSRTEKLQDVPLSITAFDSEDLVRNQVLDVRDLSRVTPSLSIFSGSGRNDPAAFSIRGLAPNTSDERYQGISFFIDGVALSGQLMSLDFAQLERVEVLKGPQSASFGRATYTGAINYITRDPGGDEMTGALRVRGSAQSGDGADSYYASAYLSTPLVKDRLWASIEGAAFRNGGLFEDRDGVAIGEERTRSAAGVLRWQPTDALNLKLRIAYSRDDDEQPPQFIQHPRDWQLLGAPTVRLSRAGGALWPTRVPDTRTGITVAGDRNIDPVIPGGGTERDRWFGSLIGTWMLAGHELSYRGGWFDSEDLRAIRSVLRATGPGEDPVFGAPLAAGSVRLNPISLTRLVSQEEFGNTSHQLMVVSPDDSRLRWKAGLYYFRETSDNWLLPLFVNAMNPTGQFKGTETLENNAIFGSVSYDLTPRLNVELEGRYQSEEVGWEACTFCAQRSSSDITSDDTAFLPRATVSFEATESNLLYALFSSGEKSGRFSQVFIAGAPAFIFAEPEELDNYELGSKNTLWDGRATLNVAAFYMDVTNQQLVSSQNILVNGVFTPITATNNVGTSRVRGFEIEGRAQLTDSLLVEAGIGYADQEFTNGEPVVLQPSSMVTFPGAATDPVVLEGKTQSNVPKVNGVVAFNYFRPTAWRDLGFGARLDGTYRGSLYGDLANIAKVPSSWRIGARLSLEGERWEAALFGRNLNDDRTTAGTGLAGGTTSCLFLENDTAVYGTNQQCLQTTVPRPREIGLEFNWRF